MSDKVRDQVEDTHAHQDLPTAHSLNEAASAGNTLQGYAAINEKSASQVEEEGAESIEALAHSFYLEREQSGGEGSAHDDWLRAESEILQRRAEKKKD